MCDIKFLACFQQGFAYNIFYVYFFFSQKALMNNGPSKSQGKYSKLDNEIEENNQNYIDESRQQQQVNNGFSFNFL